MLSGSARPLAQGSEFDAAILMPVGERVTFEIGTITLDWSDWAPWNALLADARGGPGAAIPNEQPGVYQVKRSEHLGDERLTGGARIRAEQDVARRVVRWARTGRPAAAEEDLHPAYTLKFGRLPEYVRNT